MLSPYESSSTQNMCFLVLPTFFIKVGLKLFNTTTGSLFSCPKGPIFFMSSINLVFIICKSKIVSISKKLFLFIEISANQLGIKIQWEGKGLQEKGYDQKGNCIIKVSERYFRPSEVETLLGDPRKAQKKLGWKPKISFKELVSEMVKNDLKIARLLKKN